MWGGLFGGKPEGVTVPATAAPSVAPPGSPPRRQAQSRHPTSPFTNGAGRDDFVRRHASSSSSKSQQSKEHPPPQPSCSTTVVASRISQFDPASMDKRLMAKMQHLQAMNAISPQRSKRTALLAGQNNAANKSPTSAPKTRPPNKVKAAEKPSAPLPKPKAADKSSPATSSPATPAKAPQQAECDRVPDSTPIPAKPSERKATSSAISIPEELLSLPENAEAAVLLRQLISREEALSKLLKVHEEESRAALEKLQSESRRVKGDMREELELTRAKIALRSSRLSTPSPDRTSAPRSSSPFSSCRDSILLATQMEANCPDGPGGGGMGCCCGTPSFSSRTGAGGSCTMSSPSMISFLSVSSPEKSRPVDVAWTPPRQAWPTVIEDEKVGDHDEELLTDPLVSGGKLSASHNLSTPASSRLAASAESSALETPSTQQRNWFSFLEVFDPNSQTHSRKATPEAPQTKSLTTPEAPRTKSFTTPEASRTKSHKPSNALSLRTPQRSHRPAATAAAHHLQQHSQRTPQSSHRPSKERLLPPASSHRSPGPNSPPPAGPGGSTTDRTFSKRVGKSSGKAAADSDAFNSCISSPVTSSPSGRQHSNVERRKDIREADMVSNIDFIVAKPGATRNVNNTKEASWVPSQAWFESLRYYPTAEEAMRHDESSHTYSGLTHASERSMHLETNVRTRLGLAPADPDWTPSQLPLVWAPNVGQRLGSPHRWSAPRSRDGSPSRHLGPGEMANMAV
jgi:hypothetical protein